MEPPHPPSSRSWSIHGRADISARYEILGRVGSGAYSDVYRGRRRFDGLAVALKEIHDYQSALRELEALQALRGSPNVVALLEHFWNDDNNEDAVLVLEFLPVDLAAVIRDGRRNGGIWVGELKQWIAQILRGVDACHRNSVVHRDLKPENLLVSQDGMLKLADFGQARILHESKFISIDNDSHGQGSDTWMPQHPAPIEQLNKPLQDGPESQASTEPNPIYEDDYLQEIAGLKAKYVMDETDKETSLLDGDASCLATCSTGDIEDDTFKGSYSYEVAEGGDDESGSLTSCVGTRWYRAPELLYGSTSYGQEVDLWSLGCIFAELLSLQPLFSGMSDLDQLAKIISVLGDMNEATAPGCSKLPDYNKISFNKVENPVGLEECLPNRSPAEINLIKKLVCYDPGNRATAMELLSDAYFSEDPLPAPLNELRVPSTKDEHDDSSPEDWGDHRDLELDSDMEEFGDMDVVTTEKGFSMRFS